MNTVNEVMQESNDDPVFIGPLHNINDFEQNDPIRQAFKAQDKLEAIREELRYWVDHELAEMIMAIIDG